jgi:phytoene dehydrogenase-like protein
MSTIVIGGGLAGLTAATILAERGEPVTVLERRGRLGGRATTDERHGHLFNQGPHAMYLRGRGLAILRELGIDPPGGMPPTRGTLAVSGTEVGLLPADGRSLLRTPWVRGRERLEVARALAGLHRIDPVPLADRSAVSWLGSTFRAERVRALIGGLVRVTTYCADLDNLSADVGVAQLQLALGGVRYVDGGWQSIVDLLAGRASQAGAAIRCDAAVSSVRRDAGGLSVRTSGGAERADAVIVAVSSPGLAARLTRSEAIQRWSRSAVPLTAAALDVGLRRLPIPGNRFAFGIDRPLYYSVHNPPAELGAGSTLHVMRYLHPDDASLGAEQVRAQLESFLDLLQPGWRGELVTARFQRTLVVSNAIPTPATGGAAGRFPPAVPGIDGLFVAGDWVGPAGHLADASIASARASAESVLGATLVAA